LSAFPTTTAAQNLGEYTSTGDVVIEVASVAGLIPAFLSDLASLLFSIVYAIP
jgi:hypothetical protein